MSFFKKKSATSEDFASRGGGGDCSMFGITRDQLSKLMRLDAKELIKKLNSSEYNGVEGILEKLKVDRYKGLDSNNQEDYQQRRSAYGKNEIPPKPISLLQLPWNWIKERRSRRLQTEFEKRQQATVLRDSRMQEILATEVVIGDLCSLKSGDTIPADGLIVQAMDLKTDESSLTGEAEPITKNENTDVRLFSGTKVKEGSATMVVVAVGPNTFLGTILTSLYTT